MSPISRSEISRLRTLKSPKGRKEELQFLAEGTKLLAELARSACAVDHVYRTERYNEGGLEEFDDRLSIISEKTMTQISTLTTPPGVLAVVNMPAEQVITYEPGVILLLDRISDPGNMGTILRNADWFGVERVICLEDCVDIYNPKVVQASMGSIFRLKVDYLSISDLASGVPNKFSIVLAEKKGVPYEAFTFPENTILAIGNESHGISEAVRSLSTDSICIPGAENRAESLNAAVASGILLSSLYGVKK